MLLKDSIDEEIKEEYPQNSQDVEMEDEEEKVLESQSKQKLHKKEDILDLVTHAVCGTWSSIFVTQTTKTRLHVWGGEEEIINSSFVLYKNLDEGNTIEYLKFRGGKILYINKAGELHEYSIKNKRIKLLEQLPRF